MIASVGSWIAGSGTSSTRTSRLPCQVRAFIRKPYPARQRVCVFVSARSASVEWTVGAVPTRAVDPPVVAVARLAAGHSRKQRADQHDGERDDRACRDVALVDRNARQVEPFE